MIVLLMGVSGAGKSTVGTLLAEALEADFAEGDAYHPPENVEKMRRGEPLSDADRAPWLATLAAEIARWRAEQRSVVLACSALKRKYRQSLGAEAHGLQVVYLRGSRELIAGRLAARQHHYMPASLLDSQFEALEEPEGAITVDVASGPQTLVQQILLRLRRPL